MTTFRRAEIDWLYGGLARFFPEAFQRFRDHVPEAADDANLIEAYSKRMSHPEIGVRIAAAQAWCEWEDAALSFEPNARESGYKELAATDAIAFVRICTHYLLHDAWLEDGALIRDASRLTGIPGVLIHGRRDMTCPIDTAWALARAWPGASLVDLADAGHLRSDSKRAALLRALDDFVRS